MSAPVIELEDIAFAYPGQAPILRGVNLAIAHGERVGLTGPNGSGKTTLLRLMVGLERPTRGTLRLFGQQRSSERDFIEARRRVGLVFQNPDDQLFCPTVLEDIAFGPLNLGLPPAQAQHKAREILDQLGLQGYEQRGAWRLSGGEKRLVALACVLAMEPDALLLDEPMAGLDAHARQRVSQALRQLPQTALIVSHDVAYLSEQTDRSYILEAQCVRPTR